VETENLQIAPISMAVSFDTDPWFTQLYGAICWQFEWSGANAFDSQVEVQVSLDKVNWNCYGGDYGQCILSAASGAQMLEIPTVTFPYWRAHYTANANTSGTMVIRTYGKPLHPRT
jgi:hypothetical protein